MRQYFKRISLNLGAQTFSKLISLALGLLNVGLITRYLGGSGYGNFVLAFAYFSFFGVLADFGFHLTMVRDLAAGKRGNKIYNAFLSLKLIFIIFSLIFAIVILSFFPYSNFVKMGIILGGLGSSIGILNTYGTSIFQAQLRLDLVAILEIITKISTTLFIALFIYLNLGFYFILISVFLGNLCGSIFIYLSIVRTTSLKLALDLKIAKKIISRSFPIFLVSLLSILYFKLDILILSFFRDSKEIGAYGLSYKIIENLLVFWGFFMASLYPLFSKLKNKKDEQKKLFKNSFLIALSSSFFLVLLLFPLTPYVIRLVAGNDFSQSTFLLKILLVALPFFFINNLYFHFFLSINKIRFITIPIFISLILNLVLNLMTIPSFGATAAAINTCVVEFSLLGAYLYFFSKGGCGKGVVIRG